MFEQLGQIERRLDAVTYQIYGFGQRIEAVHAELDRLPAASGWRSLRKDIASLRWRFVILPRATRRATAALNSTAAAGLVALVFV